MKKKTLPEIKEYLLKNGCVLLSTEYKSNQYPIEYIGQCGHVCKQTFGYFQQGHGRVCTACNKREHFGIEHVKEIIEQNGCKLLSTEYKNAKQKLKILMKCGHEYFVSFNGFQNMEFKECRSCVQKRQNPNPTLTHNAVEKLFSDNGCVLISNDYENNHTKLKYIAQCGHLNEITQNNFLRGAGRVCPLCQNHLGSEKIVFDIIKTLYPDVILHYNIKSTDHKHGQFLDFYIPSLNIGIEYNGLQHYEFVPFFHRSIKGWIHQIKRDDKKRLYCQKEGITLIEIDGRIHTKSNMTIKSIQNVIDEKIMEQYK